METESVDRLWQAVMRVAAAMKKDGLDTGDAVKRLRDARVLVNHCKNDEHAHGDELFEAELEIQEIQTYLIGLLEEAGRKSDYSFETRPLEHDKAVLSGGTPSSVPKDKKWARIRLPEGFNPNSISEIEGVDVLEKDKGTITIAGDDTSLQKAFALISKVYSG